MTWEKVTVPRAQVAELLRLPVDIDDETLQNAMAETVARQKAREAEAVNAAAESRLVAEDRRLVNAAYNDGRIANRDNWVNALAANRRENRALLASLAPGLPPEQKVAVDQELEAIHGQVLARMGIRPAFAGPRPVAAASAEENLSGLTMNSSIPVDMLGFSIPQVPPPVRIRRGTDPADWTWQEHSDHFQRQLGQRFWPGTKPPPPRDVWYQPSPNDHSEFVETPDGQGYWREEPNYQARG